MQCKPGQIPEKIEVDVSNLKIAESIHISDVKAPEGVKFKTNVIKNATIAVVAVPEKEEVVVAPAAAVPGTGEAAVPATGAPGSAPAAGAAAGAPAAGAPAAGAPAAKAGAAKAGAAKAPEKGKK